MAADPPDEERYQHIISALPLEDRLLRLNLRKYGGFWYPEATLPAAMAFKDLYAPRPGDLVLASPPKAGTTWLKALAFAVLTRKDYDRRITHPLLTRTPHDCVPFLDSVFGPGGSSSPPTLSATHMPFSLLPDSLTSASSEHGKIVYVCRDPKDTLVSDWHFRHRMLLPEVSSPISFGGFFDLFCRGVSAFGPVWDHNLEYWRASLERPDKVLFFKYEEMARDPMESVRRLAEFAGQPFSPEEEEEGLVEEIVRLCSFEKLSNVQANRVGDHQIVPGRVVFQNSSFFRKGMVGDWKSLLTAEMAQRLDGITEEKLRGSGLSFNNS